MLTETLPQKEQDPSVGTSGRLHDDAPLASGERVVWISADEAQAASLPCASGAPALSARDGMTTGQKLVVAVVVLAACAAPCVPALRLALLLAVGCLILGASLLRIVAALASLDLQPADAPVHDAMLPSYTVMVPLYREAAVVPQLLAALDALDYPRALLDVKLLLEAADPVTLAAVLAERLPSHVEVLVMPDGAPRTKPRALNAALARARGDLVTVFDAEDLPDRDQLRLAAARFAAQPDLACLQARLAIDNGDDGWLCGLFAIEYAVLFDVLNPGLAKLRLPILLGGTSNHFRRAALEATCGWDAWNVTEDADLGLRLARLHLRVEVLASSTLEEAPADPQAWLRQRRRWMKGWVQTAGVHFRLPQQLFRQLGPRDGMAALLILANGLLMPLFGIPLTALFAHDLVNGALFRSVSPLGVALDLFWCLNGVMGLAALILPLCLAFRRRRLARWRGALLFMPLRWGLMTLAGWAALVDLWRRPFYWGTTSHGRARRPLG